MAKGDAEMRFAGEFGLGLTTGFNGATEITHRTKTEQDPIVGFTPIVEFKRGGPVAGFGLGCLGPGKRRGEPG